MISKTPIEIAKTRESWIDDVKMFAILCVVISHCFHYFSIQPYEASPIRPFVNAFNMHLFALISGYNAYRGITKISGVKQLIAYFEKLALRIALPCIGFSILYHIVQSANIRITVVWFMGFAVFCCFVWLFTCSEISDYGKCGIIHKLKQTGGGYYYKILY